jgi:serine/threonine-protein kinase RsbW
MLAARIESTGATFTGSPLFQDDWHRTRFSSVKEMPSVIEAVVGFMNEIGYSHKDIFSVHLMLEEAVVNAIKHGHQNDPSKEVEVRYSIGRDFVLVEVEDEGPGFILSMVPDATSPENLDRPSGRGLLLIRRYATWVRFNNWGNCVIFCKCPTEPLDAEE